MRVRLEHVSSSLALSNRMSISIPAGEVVVKFAQRYNVHAHKFLAGTGLAAEEPTIVPFIVYCMEKCKSELES